MYRVSWLLVFLLLVTTVASAKYDPISQAPDIPEGWSPAQASDWQGAKIRYTKAQERHGTNSPQAAKAKKRMRTLGRNIGAEELPTTFTEKPNPGTFGTYAPPEVFYNWVPLEPTE